MPTNLSGRVILIIGVLYGALSLIFQWTPPSFVWLFRNLHEPISLRTALKPGIDMVGGTSLLYEIKVPPGGYQSNLAEQVMNSLKKRVDPQGVRNLIWRPQGATRLEIQMPLNEKSMEIGELRKRFATAQTALETTNLRPGEVLYTVEELKGDARDAKLKELAQGSTTRTRLLQDLAATTDGIVAAQTARDAAKQAELQLHRDQLIEMLNDTNLLVSDLQTLLDQKPEARDRGLEEIRKRSADFPVRLAAIDTFVKEYGTFSSVKGAIDDAAELKQLLKGSGVIEFHILADDLPAAQRQEMVERLLRRGPRPQAGDEVRWYEIDRGPEVIEQMDRAVQELILSTDDHDRLTVIKRVAEGNEHIEGLMRAMVANLSNPSQREALKNQVEDSLLLGGHELVNYGGKKWALAYITREKSLMRREGQPEWHLEKANPTMDNGSRQVAFRFDAQGAKFFGDLTGNNLHRPLAIVLDDRMISAPNINSQINGSGVITGGGRGGFSQQELTYLVNTLNAGALPAQLAEEPISEQTVGPQLGADNLRSGLQSSLYGLLAVAIFMIIYYHMSGVVAIVALAMNMIIILAVMSALEATWTLPAVAGIVLTIGMSVDANVLIFERLREEQQRGLSLKMAMRNAYDRAASAIIDSNAITAITCLILYWIGSEEVKGFGLTLLIGLVSSLFTALFVTKTIFAIMLKYFNLQKLGCLPVSWPALGRLLHPNVHWIGLAKYFMAASAVVILLGGIALVATFNRKELFDIEFVSGTSVQFELKEPMPRPQVVELLAKAGEDKLPSPTVVAVGTGEKSYEVVTPSNNAKQVTDAILVQLSGKLNILEPSTYDHATEAYTDAIDKAIFPITAETRTIAGMVPKNLRSHVGGVAIVLNHLTPKLSEEDVRKRLEQIRLQPQAGGEASRSQYRQVDVESFGDGSTAVVLTSDPGAQYDANDPVKVEQWNTDLVKPMWAMVRDAINNPPRLQKVSNFDAQVAGQMQSNAFGALTLSLIVIMAYIWLRFGNLKYGAATVAAMLHDTLLVIGFIGLSHYIGYGFGRNFLLIEPFRVNLTLVAAVLTVMSYSMVDTIVVFDRIRENRGKFGHLDAQIINDSVNQTLSRTLLTVTTTVLSVLVMYIKGGPGIHGFTFVMLIGILIGTYSSFAIAAPILLIGEKQPHSTGRGTAGGRRQQLQGA